MKITTAIFDLDGTLLNTLGDLCDSVNCAVLRRGFPAVTEEQTRLRVGHGIRRLIEQCIPENKRTEAMLDNCLDDFRTAYSERMMNRTQPYDGILPLLKALKKAGIAVGVLSNKYDVAAKNLIRHYFGDLVQVTCGERPDTPRKPDPTSTLRLLRELGGDATTTLYIGDSAVDMQTAKNAGLTAVGVTWGFRPAEELKAAGADALVNEPAELLPLFERGLLNVDALCKTFTSRGFGFTYFANTADALPYLINTCAGKAVTLGGSMTLKELGFPEAFSHSTAVHWHWIKQGEFFQTPDIYLSSANALSETGEIVNIDGKCNRVAGTLFGPKRCIFVCGVNKLCPDLESAIERARNIAAPRNAQRLGAKTPCAVDGKCHDCQSPDRLCRAMVIHMGPPNGMEKCELVLIGESLGY
ncbi:HAD-IIIA family hydrolase [Agathobaculum desmolans]|uniref:HAD-IIIA family hydrolase n=1 Tax=Agathobaculum desmolans TaxID=39484 RepID=UPI00248D8378|nr:HAD-IIIA family hydrolase [Agathobaculum desmolans]